MVTFFLCSVAALAGASSASNGPTIEASVDGLVLDAGGAETKVHISPTLALRGIPDVGEAITTGAAEAAANAAALDAVLAAMHNQTLEIVVLKAADVARKAEIAALKETNKAEVALLKAADVAHKAELNKLVEAMAKLEGAINTAATTQAEHAEQIGAVAASGVSTNALVAANTRQVTEAANAIAANTKATAAMKKLVEAQEAAGMKVYTANGAVVPVGGAFLLTTSDAIPQGWTDQGACNGFGDTKRTVLDRIDQPKIPAWRIHRGWNESLERWLHSSLDV